MPNLTVFKKLLLFFCIVTSFHLSAQKGDFRLSHYSLDIEGLDNHNFELKVNPHGQLCIANRSGLLLYEGDTWDYLSTPSAALSVSYDADNNVYVGCVGDFGKIDFEQDEFQFISLNPNKSDESLYFRTIAADSNVYYLSETTLIRYHGTQNKSYLTYLNDEEEYFTNMFHLDGIIIVQTNKKLYQYDDDKLIDEIDWELPEDAEFLFFDKHPKDNRYVVGTSDNRVFIYKDKKFYDCKMTAFLTKNESFVNNGVWVDEQHFALSTLEDGIILYSNRESKIIDVINNEKGLPDNEIYAIGRDKEQGLWISHEFGLSRLEIKMPFRSFTNYAGLEGNIKDIYWYKGQVYVSTSKGVFFLEEKKEYKNTVYYVPVKGKKIATTKPTHILPEKKKRGSVFSKLKKKISKKDKAVIAKSSSKRRNKTKYIKKIRREFVGSKYVFTKVEGINAKCEKFLTFKRKLLIASSKGVYEIKDEISKDKKERKKVGELAIHEPIRFIFKENKKDRLVMATHYNQLKIYILENDIWIEDDELDFHGELVLSALHQGNGMTWFVTPSHLYRYDQLSSEYTDPVSYEYHNRFIDDVRLTAIDKQLYMINSDGYFYLDNKTHTILQDTALLAKTGRPIKHLQEHGGKVWVYNGEAWFDINKDKTVKRRDIFGLFPDMSFITNYKNNIWLIDQSKELLKYYPNEKDSLFSENKMFFREVKSNKRDINLSEEIVFEHDENAFYFNLARPDYLGLLKVEYQYKMKGLNDEWSKWSKNNQIPFPYLPPNNYQLQIRSRDAFGHVQESQVVDFKIKKPYWQTLWFYGLQILVMMGLMIGSLLMNRKAQEKYVIITEGLTILTIVMVIEFMQTVAGSYLGIQSTPVVDFGIDVSIALCVFPLEQLLKKMMKVEKTGDGFDGKGIFDFLKPSKG